MAEWNEGDQCRLVQHDAATRQPLEGGSAFRGTVEAVTGTRALVRLEVGTVLAAVEDWVAEPGGGLWRLVPASGQPAPCAYCEDDPDHPDPDNPGTCTCRAPGCGRGWCPQRDDGPDSGEDCGCGLGPDRCLAAEDGDLGG